MSGALAQSSFVITNPDNEEATLSVFLPAEDIATGRAVVCCPGGGYQHVCMDYEGTDWAPYFNDMGIAYAVLKYRMPKGNREIPLSDADWAMTTLRENAEQWNINTADVGIMGFSAGGHLASTIATHGSDEVRPNFQILFYPVISMDQFLGHQGSSENFLGDDVADPELIEEYSNMNKVNANTTPPAIIFLAQDDHVVPPLNNGIPYYIALSKNHIKAALHCYTHGGHGWRPNRFPFYDEMLTTLTNWLNTF